MSDYIAINRSQLLIEEANAINKTYVLGIKLSGNLNVVLPMQLIYKESSNQNEEIQVILSKKGSFNLFVEDVDFSKDGSSHYIEYKGEDLDAEDGLFIEKDNPIYSSPMGPDSITIGYKGTIVGRCFRKGTYLTYDTKDQCNGFFRSEEFAHYDPNCLHLVVSPELSIPINSYYEKLWNIKEGKKYIFECQFGYDGGWGDPGYQQYAEYLYISGFITDRDFDPKN